MVGVKFDEALFRLRIEIEKEYGKSDGIVKIGIHPWLMDRIVRELVDKSLYDIRPSNFGELKLYGIVLVPRLPDDF